MSENYGRKYTTARYRLFGLLRDLAWHSRVQLENVAGVRYGARILELKREGYAIETKKWDEHGKAYRLVSLEKGEPQLKRVKAFFVPTDAELLVLGEVTATARSAVREALASFRENAGKL